MSLEGQSERPVKVVAAAEEARPKPAPVAEPKPAVSEEEQEAKRKRKQAEKREVRMRAMVAQQLASMPAADPQASAKAARELRRKRMRALAVRLSAWVGGPVLLAALYYTVFAQPQYESAAVLLVRGEHSEQRVAALREYLSSRDVLADLETEDHFSEHFMGSSDPLARLAPDAGSESRYRMFLERIRIDTSAGTGVVKVSIRAFSSAHAQRFLQTIVRSSDTALQRIFPGVNAAPDSGRIAVVSRPSRPTESSYPKRAGSILSVAVVCLLLFGVGSLLLSAIREHAHF